MICEGLELSSSWYLTRAAMALERPAQPRPWALPFLPWAAGPGQWSQPDDNIARAPSLMDPAVEQALSGSIKSLRMVLFFPCLQDT